MSSQYEEFSKAIASVVFDYQSQGISDAEAVGALRLVAASLEAKASGGFVAHMFVIEVEPVDGPCEDEDWWKNGG